MNEKIEFKKTAGYFWVVTAILWIIFIVVIISTSQNFILIAIATLNVVISGLNGYLFLSGSNYILITDVGVEVKHSFIKPKSINFDHMKSVHMKKRMLGKAICITRMGKPYYIYDGYQKSLDDIKQTISNRID